MFRSVLVLGLLSVIATDAHATPLRDRVEALEERLAAVEARLGAPVAPPAVRWSCRANCGYYSGRSIISSSVTGSGTTAARAYNDMDRNCSDHLFLAPANDDRHTLVAPSIAEACVRE